MDDFERELRRTFGERTAGLPESYDAPPELVARARRRRAAKVGAFAVALVVVAAGTAAAVAQVVDRHRTDRLVTSTPSSTSAPTTTSKTPTTRPVPKQVATVACPITDPMSRSWGKTPTTPRVPAAGDPAVFAHLQSFAATADPRYAVLGPTAWSCQGQMATDGDNGMVVYDPAVASGVVPDLAHSPIAIENDFLWHGGVGSVAACRASGNPAALQFVTKNFPELLPCPSPGRTVTQVDAHVTRFADADGARGAVWIVLPSSEGADDGQLSILTCRPTAGLTAAQCDTIIADYVARIDTSAVTTTLPTTTPTTSTVPTGPSVRTVACSVLSANPHARPPAPPSTAARVPAAGDPSLFGGLASFAGTTDPRYVVLGPAAWSCQMERFEDGRIDVVVSDQPPSLFPNPPDASRVPIAIMNDYLWHGGVGSVTACSVFDDPAVVQFVTRNYPRDLPCPKAGRHVTRVDARVSTFVDADGARGGGWMVLPSSGGDGLISVLTCRPTAGLTAADCDTIVADYVTRVDRAG